MNYKDIQTLKKILPILPTQEREKVQSIIEKEEPFSWHYIEDGDFPRESCVVYCRCMIRGGFGTLEFYYDCDKKEFGFTGERIDEKGKIIIEWANALQFVDKIIRWRYEDVYD